MDRLPVEIKLHLFELRARESFEALRALSRCCHSFYAVYKAHALSLLRMALIEGERASKLSYERALCLASLQRPCRIRTDKCLSSVQSIDELETIQNLKQIREGTMTVNEQLLTTAITHFKLVREVAIRNFTAWHEWYFSVPRGRLAHEGMPEDHLQGIFVGVLFGTAGLRTEEPDFKLAYAAEKVILDASPDAPQNRYPNTVRKPVIDGFEFRALQQAMLLHTLATLSCGVVEGRRVFYFRGCEARYANTLMAQIDAKHYSRLYVGMDWRVLAQMQIANYHHDRVRLLKDYIEANMDCLCTGDPENDIFVPLSSWEDPYEYSGEFFKGLEPSESRCI